MLYPHQDLSCSLAKPQPAFKNSVIVYQSFDIASLTTHCYTSNLSLSNNIPPSINHNTVDLDAPNTEYYTYASWTNISLTATYIMLASCVCYSTHKHGVFKYGLYASGLLGMHFAHKWFIKNIPDALSIEHHIPAEFIVSEGLQSLSTILVYQPIRILTHSIISVMTLPQHSKSSPIMLGIEKTLPLAASFVAAKILIDGLNALFIHTGIDSDYIIPHVLDIKTISAATLANHEAQQMIQWFGASKTSAIIVGAAAKSLVNSVMKYPEQISHEPYKLLKSLVVDTFTNSLAKQFRIHYLSEDHLKETMSESILEQLRFYWQKSIIRAGAKQIKNFIYSQLENNVEKSLPDDMHFAIVSCTKATDSDEWIWTGMCKLEDAITNPCASLDSADYSHALIISNLHIY